MITWQPANIKFALLTVVALAGSATILATLWPHTLNAARQQSNSLIGEGQRASGGEAEVDFRLATWLNPDNQAAYVGLARTQILGGHADLALQTLARAGEGSEVEQLKVRTLIELGRYNEAANEAAKLANSNRTPDDIILAALSFALAQRPVDDSLATRLSSSEAAQRIRRAQAGQLPLATELYAAGLLQSSSAMLTKLTASYERNLLLARIRYTRHTAVDLAMARSQLQEAIALDPARLDGRRLLIRICDEQHDSGEVAHQRTLVARLESGQF